MRWFIHRLIATKLLISFACVIAIGVCIAAVTEHNLARLETAQGWTEHTYQVLGVSKRLLVGVLKQQGVLNGETWHPTATALERARAEDAALSAALVRIRSLTADNPSQQARLLTLADLLAKWRDHFDAARPDGPQHDDAADDLIGKLQATLLQIDAEEERLLVLRSGVQQAAFKSVFATNLFGPLVAIAAALCLAYLLRHVIAVPIGRLTGAMRRLAEGDTAVRIPNVEWHEEIGEMSRALDILKTNMIEKDRLRAEGRELRDKGATERLRLQASMADRFEQVVGSIVHAVSASATQMQGSAEQLQHFAEWTSGEVDQVASATKDASATMQTVAGDTDHLSDSVGEISAQMARSADVAHQAVSEADRTTATIEGLSDTAKRIGLVIDLINGVANQTNLLALNATIEAARAGESGRGFAVVAAEVKSLASQTSRATDDIRRQIEEIQAAATSSVLAIGQISSTIGQMAHITRDIMAAVDTHRDGTREMAHSTQETALVTANVSTKLDEVRKGALTTGDAATRLLASARDLAVQSTTLREEAGRFVASVRAG